MRTRRISTGYVSFATINMQTVGTYLSHIKKNHSQICPENISRLAGPLVGLKGPSNAGIGFRP